MFRSPSRRLAVWIAIVCLAVTVVALGAAAKHSQFESASHGTSFLAQSVKMVASDYTEAIVAAPVCIPEPMARPASVPERRPPVPHNLNLSRSSPLLV